MSKLTSSSKKTESARENWRCLCHLVYPNCPSVSASSSSFCVTKSAIYNTEFLGTSLEVVGIDEGHNTNSYNKQQ